MTTTISATHECVFCGSRLNLAETESGYACPSCRDRFGYELCDRCGTYGRYPHTHDGVNYCSSCYREVTHSCGNCGDHFFEEDGYYDGGRWYCCEDCYDEYEERNYDDLDWWSSDDIMWQARGNAFISPYMGVELEIDNGDSRRRFHMEAQENFGDFFLYKTDSSLSSDGLEIVTHPATLSYHMDSAGWKGMLQLAKDHGFTSHDNNRCGLHIHLDREFFGSGRMVQTAHALKMMRVLERFQYQFDRFSRRTDFGWCKRNSVEPIDRSLAERVNRKMFGYDEDRYYAINIRNDETIEVRLWRGTLNHETFMATLQMTAGLAMVCKHNSETYLENITWYDLCEAIGEAAKEMIGREAVELGNYLSRRGLNNVEYDENMEEVA